MCELRVSIVFLAPNGVIVRIRLSKHLEKYNALQKTEHHCYWF